MAFLIFILSVGSFVAKISQIGGRFWKKHFFTQLAVVHCDPSSSHVWLMVGGGGRTSICGMAKD
jgi:hypothetical protein